MEGENCSLLCFCSNRNKLPESKFSTILLELAKLQYRCSPLQETLMKKEIYCCRDEYYLSKKIRLRFALYVLPPKAQVKSALSGLKKEATALFGESKTMINILPKFSIESPSFSLSLRAEARRNNKFGPMVFSCLPSHIERSLSILKEVTKEEFDVQECVQLLFEKEKTVLAGGLNLPMKLELSTELTEKTGEASVQGLELNFKKSPLGLGQVSFSLQKDTLLVRVIAFPILQISKETLGAVYNHSAKIANLFLKTPNR